MDEPRRYPRLLHPQRAYASRYAPSTSIGKATAASSPLCPTGKRDKVRNEVSATKMRTSSQ